MNIDIRKELERKMPSVDELFTTQVMRDEDKLEKIYEIPISEIDDFEGHPFLVRDDEDMDKLVESIMLQGQTTPAIVRPKDNGRYELISGHRRRRACELAGWKTLKCEVKQMTRDEAIICMTDCNLQRSVILASEKAKMYLMRSEAIKRLKEEEKSLRVPLEPAGRTAEILSKETGESESQVKRYIRLNYLIPELLNLVDSGKMGMRPAVELSYISEEGQQWILYYIDFCEAIPSHDQAIRLKAASDIGELNKDRVADIMNELKPNQRNSAYIKSNKIMELFPEDLPISQRENYIISSMKNYRRIYEKHKADRAREDDMER